MPRTQHSICRVCQNSCAVLVDLDDDGRIMAVRGDKDDPVYHGYTCEKGRNSARSYTDPSRMIRSVKREADGSHSTIATSRAIEEIGDRLRSILDEHGPRSIALFFGTNFTLDSPLSLTFSMAFMNAIGSPMTFSPETIDQPGKTIAKAVHGIWMAPGQAANDPDVALLIGNNPLVSHQGRYAAPGDFISDIKARGGDVIVVDPRRTETAARSTMFLQPQPGCDSEILAAIINVILSEERHDAEFIDAETKGLDALRAAVAPFTPGLVAQRADVTAEDLVEVARRFAGAGRGYAAAGTGPNMTAKGSLIEYLLLCLDTICGHRLRAGERVLNPLTFVPKGAQPAKAQALPPFPATGDGYPAMRVRGMTHSVSGPPASALADEILLPGEGQIRALISVGANPANCVPDQHKIVEALGSLDLLVQTDVRMSTTASLAHYVIAPTIPFESPGSTILPDLYAMYADDWGFPGGYAHYVPKIVDPPADADVIEQWRFLFRVAQRMELQLRLPPGVLGVGGLPGDDGLELDMAVEPDTDELMAHLHRGGRISLDEAKRHGSGAVYPDPPVVVMPKDEGWKGRLNIGSSKMLADLAALLTEADVEREDHAFRLISRRSPQVMNSRSLTLPTRRPDYNAAFLHPDDLADLGVRAGDHVRIESSRSSVIAIADQDPTLRRGLVSMSHNWGHLPAGDARAAGSATDSPLPGVGTNSGALVADDGVLDPYSGQPRMSNVPVTVTPADATSISSAGTRPLDR